MMVRMSIWKASGGFDGRFFAHMEEIDWCWRAQLAGYDICFIPGPAVYHVGGGTLPAGSPAKVKLNFRNNLLLLENNLARTLVCEGMSPKKALRLSRIRIFERMVLDGAAAAIYLVTGKPSAAKAVVTAHREYRELRRRETEESLSRWKSQPHREGYLDGVYIGSIVFASLLHGRGIFEHIRKRTI